MVNIEDLIRKARTGDQEAFEELVVIYQDRVYTHCYNLAGNSHDAEDLAQDVFVQAFKHIGSFRMHSDLGTWLHRIAVNLWINYSRRNRKMVIFSLDEPLARTEGNVFRELAAMEDDPVETIAREENREVIRTALNSIHPDYKTVLVLREMEGYSYEEIAALLECSLGTVKSRINRGRKALQNQLSRMYKKLTQ